VIGENPVTLQLRYLQTLREIGATQNSTVVFPMPIDLVKPVLEAAGGAFGAATTDGPQREELPDGAPNELTPASVGEPSVGELQPGSEAEVPAPAADRQRSDRDETSAVPRRSAEP
jgi:hypothetical protein